MKFADYSFVRIYAVPSVSCMSVAHTKIPNSVFLTMLGATATVEGKKKSGRPRHRW